MAVSYIENQEFRAIDFRIEKLHEGEYEQCNFIDCIFSDTDLTGAGFAECKFQNCDLSNAYGKSIIMRDIKFKNCKMLGYRFDQCNPFLLSFSFEDCILNFASFYKLKVKGTKFINCNLQQADFTEADLSLSVFLKCDLNGAIFQNTNLAGANFESARDFTIDPEVNQLKGAQFSAGNLAGLLARYKLKIK